MQMADSRQADRLRCLLPAKIVFNNRCSTFDCLIRNISASGAKIEIATAASLPARFELEVPHKNRIYQAEILWRDDGAIGVRFLSDGNTEAKPENKLERLEQENKRLRGRVQDLTVRLQGLDQAVEYFV